MKTCISWEITSFKHFCEAHFYAPSEACGLKTFVDTYRRNVWRDKGFSSDGLKLVCPAQVFSAVIAIKHESPENSLNSQDNLRKY